MNQNDCNEKKLNVKAVAVWTVIGAAIGTLIGVLAYYNQWLG